MCYKEETEELDKFSPGCSSVVTSKLSTLAHCLLSFGTPLTLQPEEETKCDFTSPKPNLEDEKMWMCTQPPSPPKPNLEEEKMWMFTRPPSPPKPNLEEKKMWRFTSPPSPEPERLDETMYEFISPTPNPENTEKTMCEVTTPTAKPEKAEEKMCELTPPAPEPERTEETKCVSLAEYFTTKQLTSSLFGTKLLPQNLFSEQNFSPPSHV